CTSPDSCQSGVCTGTPTPGICADHYLCYKAKASPFTPIASVHLVDEFEDVNVAVVKPRALCTPADKNGEGVMDQNTHLKSYQIKQLTPHARRTVTIQNQFFSPLSLTTIKPDLLYVPTNKDLITTPAAPDLNAISVDHYKCYRVKITSGTPKFPKGVQATVLDQFNSPAKLFDVKKPRHL